MENYGRFYAIFNKLPYKGDRDEFKRQMVSQCTLGRTEHLHEMTEREYNDCCMAMEKLIPGGETAWREQWLGSKEYFLRKKWRSNVLHLMQVMGIDTADWNRVNAFCMDGRIAGKMFRELTTEELDALYKKLRSIQSKGGLRQISVADAAGTVAKTVTMTS